MDQTSKMNNSSNNNGSNKQGGSKRAANGQRQLIGAIDQGTSSTRFLVFESGTGQMVASSQLEIKRIVPQEGWVEMDPREIMSSVYKTVESVCQDQLSPEAQNQLRCIGICNQRESAVVWDSITGEPLYNVIVWMDNRTKDLVDQMIDSVPGRDFNWFKSKTGLPMSTYFSAFKLRWLIENVEPVKEALRENRLLFGTVDSWILWNLTGRHLTDCTNASRTFLMDIETLQWDKQMCDYFNVPAKILPKILASADDFGMVQHGPLKGLPITGVIGDQSAALFGHNCLHLGQTKATFGTGCFIMQNIGPGPLNGAMSGMHRDAKKGLITTVGFRLRDKPACYALEGSIKIAGAVLTWLRDNIQLISNYEECDELINKTSNAAGVFFVPALGGLYSPYWDPNAAGIYIGLSQLSRREHLVRATFDSIAFQTNDILSLMRGVTNGLMIGGGLCKSENLCQILADITGCDIVRAAMCETSALGTAMIAGCGAGIWAYEDMLAGSYTPLDSSSSTHHYPHESLNYEEKFCHLIRTKHEKEALETVSCADHREAYDGGGGGASVDYSDSEPASSDEEESDRELQFSDTQLVISSSSNTTPKANSPDPNGNQGGQTRLNQHLSALLKPHAPTSSGYSSADCEQASSSGVLGQRHDSPMSVQLESQQDPEDAAELNQQQLDSSRYPNDSDQAPYQDSESNTLRPVATGGAPTTINAKPVDVYQPYISLEHRTDLVETWHRAVGRSMQWTKIHHEEVRRIDYQRLSSLPLSLYLLFSVGMVALSGVISSDLGSPQGGAAAVAEAAADVASYFL